MTQNTGGNEASASHWLSLDRVSSITHPKGSPRWELMENGRSLLCIEGGAGDNSNTQKRAGTSLQGCSSVAVSRRGNANGNTTEIIQKGYPGWVWVRRDL